MFTFLIMLLTIAIILTLIFVIYTAIVLIIMALKKNKVIGSGSDAGKQATTEQLSKIHIYLWAILKFGPFRFCNEDNYKERLKASIFVFNILGITTVIAGIMLSSYLFAITSSLRTIDNAMSTFVPTWIVTSGSKDCECYVECTGNAEDDEKCTYELIFGPAEYQKFLGTFTFDEEEQAELDSFTTGREIGYFLADRLTEDSVNCYADLISGKKFRSKDHVNRDAFNFDGYKGDLIKLLHDYKKDGRNPNCDCCKSAKEEILQVKCIGVKHYVPGWTWEDDPDPNPNPGPGTGNGSATLGKYTGHYQITLNDGTTWAVYHQSSDGCVYCSPCSCTSGQAVWGNTPWGDGNFKERHSFAEDGCAIYSLAMTITNLTGQDITPHQILLDLGVTYENGVYDTGTSSCFSHGSGNSGRGIVYSNATNTLAAKYNLHVATLTDKSEILTYLDKNCMIWGSWSDAIKVGGIRVPKHGENDFLWYCGVNHFMTIRAKDSSNNLYVLSSSGNSDQGYKMIDVAQAPETVDNVWDHKSSNLYAFWTDPQTDEGGGGGPITIDGDIKAKLMEAGIAEAVAERVAIIYGIIEPEYGPTVALSIAACSMCEGKIAQFENQCYGFDRNITGIANGYSTFLNCRYAIQNNQNYYYICEESGQRIGNGVQPNTVGRKVELTQEAVNYANILYRLRSKTASSADECIEFGEASDYFSLPGGTGTIQFSWNRGKQVRQYYIDGNDFTNAGLINAEGKYYLWELSNTYSGVPALAVEGHLHESTHKIFDAYVYGGRHAESACMLRTAQADLLASALGYAD